MAIYLYWTISVDDHFPVSGLDLRAAYAAGLANKYNHSGVDSLKMSPF
jgi:hypothetical protein